MANQPTPIELDSQRPGIRDIWEAGRAPGLFAIVTAAITWVIWYYTNTPCTAELSASIGCNPATIARYIDVDIFGRMLTYSAITAAAGGVWNYNMFTKMRAVIAAETKRANEAEQRLAEYRQQVRGRTAASHGGTPTPGRRTPTPGRRTPTSMGRGLSPFCRRAPAGTPGIHGRADRTHRRNRTPAPAA